MKAMCRLRLLSHGNFMAENCCGHSIMTSKKQTFEGMTVIFLSRLAHNSGFLYKFASAMNRARRILTWIRRIRHCRGFGIQSPTDYRFVRNVINEKCPYHAYEELPAGDDWLRRKLGKLYFRLANDRQPSNVIDKVGMMDYVQAGCKKARKVDDVDEVELAIVPIAIDYDRLLNRCGEQSIVVFQDIYKQMPLWHCIEYDRRVRVTFDLYYCGIVVFDSKRAPNNYIVNF